MTVAAFVLLGFMLVCVLVVRRPTSEHTPSPDRSLRPLTPAFVREVVRAAEPLCDGATSVRTVRPGDADAIASTIDDVVIGAMGWSGDVAAHHPAAVRLELLPAVMVITELDSEVAIGVVSIDPLPVKRREAYHRTVRMGIWMGPQGRGGGHMGRAVRMLVDLMITNDISVMAETAVTNNAARHILERAAMAETGQRVVRLPDGSNVDGIVYERYARRFSRRPTDHKP
jgi:Acetyltransferase (GNAT) domain